MANKSTILSAGTSLSERKRDLVFSAEPIALKCAFEIAFGAAGKQGC